MSEWDDALPTIRELNIVLKKVKSERSRKAVMDAIEAIEYLSLALDGANKRCSRAERREDDQTD